MVVCVQFITIVSLHIYSLLKVRLIFHPKKEEKKNGKINYSYETKNKFKRVTGL